MTKPTAKPAASLAVVEPAAAAAPTQPAVPTPVAAAPTTPAAPPRKVVTGEGIRITETADGQVIVKTTTTWNEALDTTYSDCTYYSAAIPVLRGQLTPARAKLLPRVCTGPTNKPKR